MFSASACLCLIVSHYRRHLLTPTERSRHGGKRWALSVLSIKRKKKKKSMNPEIYRITCKQAETTGKSCHVGPTMFCKEVCLPTRIQTAFLSTKATTGSFLKRTGHVTELVDPCASFLRYVCEIVVRDNDKKKSAVSFSVHAGAHLNLLCCFHQSSPQPDSHERQSEPSPARPNQQNATWTRMSYNYSPFPWFHPVTPSNTPLFHISVVYIEV